MLVASSETVRPSDHQTDRPTDQQTDSAGVGVGKRSRVVYMQQHPVLPPGLLVVRRDTTSTASPTS